jgi:hypothetical protein
MVVDIVLEWIKVLFYEENDYERTTSIEDISKSTIEV